MTDPLTTPLAVSRVDLDKLRRLYRDYCEAALHPALLPGATRDLALGLLHSAPEILCALEFYRHAVDVATDSITETPTLVIQLSQRENQLRLLALLAISLRREYQAQAPALTAGKFTNLVNIITNLAASAHATLEAIGDAP